MSTKKNRSKSIVGGGKRRRRTLRRSMKHRGGKPRSDEDLFLEDLQEQINQLTETGNQLLPGLKKTLQNMDRKIVYNHKIMENSKQNQRELEKRFNDDLELMRTLYSELSINYRELSKTINLVSKRVNILEDNFFPPQPKK